MVPVVLLSVLFSARAGAVVPSLALLVAFLGFVAAVGALIAGPEWTGRLTGTLLALQESSGRP